MELSAMSAYGPKQTFVRPAPMAAFGGEADIYWSRNDVWN